MWSPNLTDVHVLDSSFLLINKLVVCSHQVQIFMFWYKAFSAKHLADLHWCDPFQWNLLDISRNILLLNSLVAMHWYNHFQWNLMDMSRNILVKSLVDTLWWTLVSHTKLLCLKIAQVLRLLEVERNEAFLQNQRCGFFYVYAAIK